MWEVKGWADSGLVVCDYALCATALQAAVCVLDHQDWRWWHAGQQRLFAVFVRRVP